MPSTADVVARIRPNRRIRGMSAVLLPFDTNAAVAWSWFEAQVERTAAAGLTPAVNMDTGYVQLLDDPTKSEVLDRTAKITGGAFVAGAYVPDQEGATFALDGYLAAAAQIAERGGTPVVFPSWGLNGLDDDGWVQAMQDIGERLDSFIGFELGEAFVPYGRIVGLDAYRALVEIPSCIGAKHSSLSRQLEWDRLAVRDEVRTDFAVFTGNDLAIDMVMYGSDYLLGLSTFAPEAFARRDAFWADGDSRFHELNDLLQYLGFFTFRPPVPGYRHDAAIVHHLRGWAPSDRIPEGVPERPPSDRAVLADIVERLREYE